MKQIIDKFELRYGAIPGRCNALCKTGKPCHRYPITGHRRCHRHGGGYTRDNNKHHTQRNTSGRFCKSDVPEPTIST